LRGAAKSELGLRRGVRLLYLIVVPFESAKDSQGSHEVKKVMIGSTRAWCALMRRNFIYRKRNWISSVRIIVRFVEAMPKKVFL